jgi:hypothetical protein
MKAAAKDYDKAALLQSRHTLILKNLIKKNPTFSDQQKENLELKLQESQKRKESYLKNRN